VSWQARAYDAITWAEARLGRLRKWVVGRMPVGTTLVPPRSVRVGSSGPLPHPFQAQPGPEQVGQWHYLGTCWQCNLLPEAPCHQGTLIVPPPEG
jgi:hypothetical protein